MANISAKMQKLKLSQITSHFFANYVLDFFITKITHFLFLHIVFLWQKIFAQIGTFFRKRKMCFCFNRSFAIQTARMSEWPAFG
jgi:hypothetical protein